jgi:hypothetical protein
MNIESMQSMVYRLREDENAMSTGENKKMQDLIDKLVSAIMSGELTMDQANAMINSPIDTDMEETSVSGGGMAYNPGLDVPKKKYAAPYAEDKKDKEPKLAAGKIKKNYAVDKFGFTPAPSIPNRPSTGGMQYKALWAEKQAEINEGYLSFKKEAMLRNKSQQYHEGVKIVRKNLKDIAKMTEYLSKLKEELNTDGEIKEMKSTLKGIDEIINHIKEIYSNCKKIK